MLCWRGRHSLVSGRRRHDLLYGNVWRTGCAQAWGLYWPLFPMPFTVCLPFSLPVPCMPSMPLTVVFVKIQERHVWVWCGVGHLCTCLPCLPMHGHYTYSAVFVAVCILHSIYLNLSPLSHGNMGKMGGLAALEELLGGGRSVLLMACSSFPFS